MGFHGGAGGEKITSTEDFSVEVHFVGNSWGFEADVRPMLGQCWVNVGRLWGWKAGPSKEYIIISHMSSLVQR